MLPPRTGPTCGVIMLYSEFVVDQLKVTGCPEEIEVGFAVKLPIVGDGPVGTFYGV